MDTDQKIRDAANNLAKVLSESGRGYRVESEAIDITCVEYSETRYAYNVRVYEIEREIT